MTIGDLYAYVGGNPVSEIDPNGTDALGMNGPIGHALAKQYGGNDCEPTINVVGGGGFLYLGVGFHLSSLAGELLGVISYDSQTGGQHGRVIAGGIGKYTGGIEAVRNWNDWSESVSPIGFGNGVTAIVPKQIGPITISELNYGGILELENDELQIGGYLGGASPSGRAAGIGGYLSLTAKSNCSCQAH